jgi:hypothetical protein
LVEEGNKTTLQSTIGSSMGMEIAADFLTSGGTTARSEEYFSGVLCWSSLSSNFSKTASLA